MLLKTNNEFQLTLQTGQNGDARNVTDEEV